MSKGLTVFAAASAMLLTSAPASAFQRGRPVPARAVTAGGDAELDLCGSTSIVRRPVVVRNAPNDRARIVYRLPVGTHLSICDTGRGDTPQSNVNGYIGYLFERGRNPRCRLPSNSARVIRIPAGCRSGWIRDDNRVEQVAG